MATSTGQAILQILEADVVDSFGPSLLTFLAAVQAANGDPLKDTTAWVQLHGNLIQAAPNALGGLEGQLAGIVAAKIIAIQTKVNTPPAA